MKKALTHLKKVDPALGKLIKATGPYKLKANPEGSHFDHVVRAIVYQQLSGKAAGTIHGRVIAHFGGKNPSPKQLLKTPNETLRKLGLSHQKISYLKDLSENILQGKLPIDTLHELEDEVIIEKLTEVKGIGRWTAQMFLMFKLGRLNVLPTVDLGINKAIMELYNLKSMPKPKEVLEIGSKWAPFSTVACWYLWRSQDKSQEKSNAKSKAKPRKKTF